MAEFVYACSVKTGHPRKSFIQEPKYPLFCCGRSMVRVFDKSEEDENSGGPAKAPAAKIAKKKVRSLDRLKDKRRSR
jgi:hypothetical protein